MRYGELFDVGRKREAERVPQPSANAAVPRELAMPLALESRAKQMVVVKLGQNFEKKKRTEKFTKRK